ncbi:MAG: helix-turn-helix domain-containing protein [Firmicutes bacterium]|nr:helix-turn-helix domain-containing protein [Bacillota bacterium]
MDNATKTAEREAKRAAELEEMKVYNLTEIEPILGVTHRTLLTYIKDGRLKGVKIGGKWKVSGESLRKFINGES